MKNPLTALITGSGHRLGSSMALFLSEQGYNLVIHYNTSKKEAENLAHIIEKNGRHAYCIKVDLAKTPEKLIPLARRTVGNIDLLVNNASIFPEGSIKSFSATEIINVLKINSLAPLLLGQTYVKSQVQGNIINITDGNACNFNERYQIYRISKILLETITREQACLYAPHFRVNAIAPGIIIPAVGEKQTETLLLKTPLQKKGSMADINSALWYLINSDYVTGQIMYIDGGLHMGKV